MKYSEWVNINLQEPERSEWFANVNAKGPVQAAKILNINIEPKSLFSIIGGAFSWQDSPQKNEYWHKIYRAISNDTYITADNAIYEIF